MGAHNDSVLSETLKGLVILQQVSPKDTAKSFSIVNKCICNIHDIFFASNAFIFTYEHHLVVILKIFLNNYLIIYF